MIISIASGKGGTGKTTIATNLATSLESSVTLLDCDVEEPNSHLFIKPKSEQVEKAFAFVPEINDELCTGCGSCVEICQFNALTLIGDVILVFPELCHSCEGCLVVCPEHAVEEGRRELGDIKSSCSGLLTFVQGCLRIGEAMSPPLIKRVRDSIKPDELVIIDAPPGTSCPAIMSMKDSDFVLLVTEPTPFGLHDLVLAHEAVKQLELPCALIINRSDIGDNGVREYADSNGLPILLEIPFDRQIAEIYSRGHILVDEIPAWRQTFQSLFRKITSLVESEKVVQ